MQYIIHPKKDLAWFQCAHSSGLPPELCATASTTETTIATSNRKAQIGATSIRHGFWHLQRLKQQDRTSMNKQ